MKRLKKDYTINYKVANSNYGDITIPKGTKTDNNTALGVDKNYNFVCEYEWIKENYSSIKSILMHDVIHYGINVPKEYLED